MRIADGGRRPRLSAAPLLLLTTALVACADPPRRVGREEALSADGLVRVPSRRVSGSYVRPGADLSRYSKARIELVGVEYEREPSQRRSGPAGTHTNYALTAHQLARIEQYFLEAFERELLGKGGLSAADAAGPDVLDVRGRIVDLVVQVPPEPRPSDRSFVRRAGVLTLIVDIGDSRTGESLVRLADRRVISETGDFELYSSDSVSHTAALRKAF